MKAPVLPIHLLREQRVAAKLASQSDRSEFDLRWGVDTDGDVGGGRTQLRGRTYLSDLDIPSSNWIYGKDYSPIAPDRFFRILESLALDFTDFVFIDFGSGKGRALLLASELPFRAIIGIEFAPQLHRIAQSNIRKYSRPTQLCKSLESYCMDFLSFDIPTEPCVLYFLDPCRGILYSQMLDKIYKSWQATPRKILIVYVSPLSEHIFDSVTFLHKRARGDMDWFAVYEVQGHVLNKAR